MSKLTEFLGKRVTIAMKLRNGSIDIDGQLLPNEDGDGYKLIHYEGDEQCRFDISAKEASRISARLRRG